MSDIDIVIPVYNEAENIRRVLDTLREHVRFNYRLLICYDNDNDTTLTALKDYPQDGIVYVKNQGKGALGAVMTGFSQIASDAAIVFPADDDINAPRLNQLYEQFRDGCELVAASRFMRGGSMSGCPVIKAALVRTAAFILYNFAGMPTHDPTNGLRLFSRRLIETVPIESKAGFAFSIEYLVKAHRLGWKIRECPFHWRERKAGQSRFRVFRWLPTYLQWLFYGLATTWLRRGPGTVAVNQASAQPS